ncbi:MAG: propionyl-CoA synthetase [Candidatus Thiodiazotropha taylori]|nr:propionyl-CoA synthetase [Candidatus Thiodiazotropha taylori]MCW4275958.1 propionyl-CoA synthetase [Candidatus Thiodiazotropha taylori]MCW4324830.1 propionyl-CoA synthetase [Candidatus Thiodiazotropha taylori]
MSTHGRQSTTRGTREMSKYAEIYNHSLDDPEAFWGDVAQGLHWDKPWDQVLDASAQPSPRWFVGGQLNTCYNALDRHIEAGNGDRLALIYDSPVTDSKRSYTYTELRDEVASLAGALTAQGVNKGDRVIVYMPMIPEAAISMLACARIGAIHSVVFGGFAAKELATRIDDSKPKMVLSASCGIEPSRVVAYKPLLDEAIELSTHKPQSCIIKQRPQLAADMIDGRDLDWDQAMNDSAPADCVPVEATDPLYILYTSGTTGQPKGVVRDNGGHAAALLWSMKNIYNVEPGDVYWAASDVGWVVGHSYIVYGPLLAGCTTVIYEGKPVGTPDPGAFWRVISEYQVKVLFTAPTAFRAIKKEDPQGAYMSKYDLSCMQTLYLAGERCDPDTLHWAETMLEKPVIDHWWQTETGWAIAANPMGIEPMPVKAGSPTVAMVGYDVRILDEQGNEKADGEMGDIVIKQPLPPSCLPTLWNNETRFVDSYLRAYSGYYLTGDAGYKDEDGYLWIMSRTDDVINVAGHRLSTGQMEEVLAGHADVAECAVIGVADALKGQLPLGLVVLKSGVDRPAEELGAELVKLVRNQIGPVAAFKHISIVKRLPKTRSGKILRGTMVKIADGTEWNMPATIDDPAILDEISTSLQQMGYGK